MRHLLGVALIRLGMAVLPKETREQLSPQSRPQALRGTNTPTDGNAAPMA